MKDGLRPYVIDLEELKKNNTNEITSLMLGSFIRILMNRIFRGAPINALFRGKRSDLKALGKTIGSEKSYIESMIKYGLTDPRTFRNKSTLKVAVKNFERDTGIKWPIS